MQLVDTIRLTDVTVSYFKNKYLTNFAFIGPDGNELPDSWYWDFMCGGFSRLQEATGVQVLPKTIREERHDFILTDYTAFLFIQLRKWPVNKIIEVKAQYGDGNTITIYPNEWVTAQLSHGQLNLVPVPGTFASLRFLGTSGAWLPFAFYNHFPNYWSVTYWVGMENDEIPRIIVDAALKLAASEMLPVVGDFIYPVGVNSESISIDGMSQSRGYAKTAFDSRITRYLQSLGLQQPADNPSLLETITKNYLGIPLVSC